MKHGHGYEDTTNQILKKQDTETRGPVYARMHAVYIYIYIYTVHKNS